jgi:tetratricopeptide (TPR) repeat protein
VATYLNRLGAYEDSRTIRELAVTSASAAGDREATASSQAGLGMVLTDLGEYEQARRHLNASLRFAEDNGNERGKASVLFHLGRLEMSGGNPTAAAEFLERCLEVARRTDDHEALCWALCSLGEALHALRKHDAALTHLHEGLFHARHAGDRSAHAANLSNIAAIYEDRGDYVAAIAYCEQALVDLDDTPNMTITIEVYLRLAEIDLERGKAEVALRRLRQTMEIAQDAHNARAEARILELLGNAHVVMGDTANAAESWRRAADLHHEVGNTARSAVLRAHIRGAPPDDGNPGQLPSREAGWQ